MGRVDELAAVAAGLATSRLVTIVGLPGVGKTRLALEAAGSLGGGDGLPAPLTDLARLGPSAGADEVAGALGSALGISPVPAAEFADVVAIALGDHASLVVMDSCEHVLAAASTVIEVVLGRCPGLRVLATSRQPLGLVGEVTVGLEPLAVPAAGDGPPPDVAESVLLFCQRARQADPSFCLTDANYRAIAAICRHLGGLPLAIELAAARVSALTPSELAARLHAGMLASESRSGAPRHRTLDAAIAWSHDLLTPTEQLLFRRLPAFVGGWNQAAAEEVCAGEGLRRDAVGLALQSLVDKSLVERTNGRPGVRYSFPPTIKAFADGLWNEALPDSVALIDRHMRWCTELAVEGERGINGPRRGAWLHLMDADVANIRVAIVNSANSGRGDAALRLAAALAGYFAARGHSAEGRMWLDYAGAAAGAETPIDVRARALWANAHLSLEMLDVEAAVAAARESASVAAGTGDVGLHARSLLILGSCYLLDNRHRGRATELLEQSRTKADEAGDGWCRINALAGLAWAEMSGGNLESARALLETAAETARAGGEEAGVEVVLPLLGLVAVLQGDLARAEAVAAEALVWAEELELPQMAARALAVLAQLAGRAGNLPTARLRAGRAVGLCRKAGLRGDLVDHACLLGDLAMAAGDHTAARGHYTEAVSVMSGLDGECPRGVLGLGRVAMAGGDTWAADLLFDRAVAGARQGGNAKVVAEALVALGDVLRSSGRLDRAAARYLEALRVAQETGRPDAMADVLRAVGGLAADAGHPQPATRMLEEASALHPAGAPPVTRVGAGRTHLGAERASGQGQAISVDEAVALAMVELESFRRPEPHWERLTGQERRATVLAAKGLSNAEIAERLFVTEGTVKTHLWHAFPKLGVASRRELSRLPLPTEPDGDGEPPLATA